MPSSITHELIAKEAALAAGSVGEMALAAPGYFFLGAQGPDLFFFTGTASKTKNRGKILHRGHVYRWFEALRTSLGGKTGTEAEKCLAYALGFATHLAADTAFHPFVYRYLEREKGGHFLHQGIENDWDVYFLRTREGESATFHRYPFDLKCIAKEDILRPYLSEALTRIGLKGFSKQNFNTVCRSFRQYLGFIHGKYGGKGVAALGRGLKIHSLIDLFPQKEPKADRIGGESFSALTDGKYANADELFLAARRGAVEAMEAFYEAENAHRPLPDLFSRHLLTGQALPLDE